MIDFLSISTLSLAILYAVYFVLLEREKMHQFNRYFLLFSLLFSLIIPFITFEIYVESAVAITSTSMQPMPLSTTTVSENINYVPVVMWSIYVFITTILIIRFVRNLIRIQRKVNSNPSGQLQNATLILLTEKVLPHTFLNYIFINKDDYENKKIEEELYTHELTHVYQKHTLDILFIEILKTIFWFNPLFILYKKAIQLNHEFLADEQVVHSYDNVPFYQKLLLQKGDYKQTIYLTSNLNYLVTKKRLIMMTTTTSKSLATIKKIAVVPILSALFYICCVDVVAQEKNLKKDGSVTNADKSFEKTYFKNVRFKYYTDTYKNKAGIMIGNLSIDKLYEELTDNDKEKFTIFMYIQKPFQKKSPTQKEYDDFKNSKKYAIWIDGKYVSNEKLNNYLPNEIAHFSGSVILKNARTKKHPQPFQYWLSTHSYFDKTEMGKQKTNYGAKEVVVWSIKKDGNLPATNKINEIEKYDQKNDAYIIADKKPDFPGGIKAFYEYVGANFKTPTNYKGIGKIIAQFIVEKDGEVTNIKILRDLGSGTGDEVVRILKASPKWIPGEIANKPVRVIYNLPVSVIANK